jgi:hypothetical protein
MLRPFYTPEMNPLPIEQEAGGLSASLDAEEREKKYLAHTEIQTPDRPVRSLVAVPRAVSVIYRHRKSLISMKFCI